MEPDDRNKLITLEAALSTTEHDADTSLYSLRSLQRTVKAAKTAASTGDLKALRKVLGTILNAVEKVKDDVTSLQAGWPYSEVDEEQYLTSGAYMRELLDTARRSNLALFEHENNLACYPSTVKLQPKERALLIDRKLHRKVRPSHVVHRLLEDQKRPQRLRIAEFIELLYAAYTRTTQTRGSTERLLELYRTLTLLPSARRDYSVQEFARDVYLLDASGVSQTKDATPFRILPGATGARNRTNLLIVVTREGIEKTYYGIEFTPQ